MKRKYFAVDGAFGSNYELNPNVNLTIPQSPSSPLCLPINTDYYKVFDRIISVRLVLRLTAGISDEGADKVCLYKQQSLTTIIDKAQKLNVGDNYHIVFDITKIISDGLNNAYLIHSNTSTITFALQYSYLLIESISPFESIKNHSYVEFDIGNSLNIKVDKVSLLSYISKPLFNNIFNESYKLIYDYYNPNSQLLFLPKGWKLSVLERIILETINGEQHLVLEDSSYNKRVFKSVANNKYLDTSHTGLFIEFSNNEYKLYSPLLLNSKKLFYSNGLIKKIVKENNDEICFSYYISGLSSEINTIDITDYLGNTITIQKDILSNDISVFTVVNNQSIVYNLLSNNDGYLNSIQYLSSEQTNLDEIPLDNAPYIPISDFFSYTSDHQLKDIYSTDDYHLEINLYISSSPELSLELSHSNTNIKTRYFTREKNYVVYEENTNDATYVYYYDENNMIFGGGEHAGYIGDNDYFASPIGIFAHRFRRNQSESSGFIRPSFSSSPSDNSLYISNQEGSSYDPYLTRISNPFNVEQNTYYLLFFKANVNLTYPTRHNDDRQFSAYSSQIDQDERKRVCVVNDNGIQYYYGIFNSDAQTQATVIFRLTNEIGSIMISDIYVIKMEDFVHQFMFNGITSQGTYMVNGTSYGGVISAFISDDSKKLLYESDIKLNRFLYLKNGNTNIFYYNDLNDVILDNNNIQIKVNNTTQFTFSSKIVAFIKKQESNLYFDIPSSETYNNQSVFRIDSYLIKNSNTYNKYSILDHHWKNMESTDYYGVKTKNTFDSYDNISESEISNNNDSLKIIDSYLCYSNILLETMTSKVGNNENVSVSYAYNSTTNVLSSVTDGKNHTTNYSHSKHYEYISSISNSNHQVSNKYYSYLDLFYVSDGQSKFYYSYNNKNEINGIYYKYEENNNIISVNLVSISRSYNNYQLTKTSTYSNNQYVESQFDKYNRIKRIDYGNNVYATFTYSSPNSAITSLYSDARLTSIIDYCSSSTITKSISYNSYDQISSILLLDSIGTTIFNNSYDVCHRLNKKTEDISGSSITDVNSYKRETTFTYNDIDDSTISVKDRLYKPSSIFNPLLNESIAIQTSITKDSLNRVSTLSTNVIDGFLTYSNALSSSYTYYTAENTIDTCHQIEKIIYENGTFLRYKYDKNGNISMIINHNETVDVSFSYDANNQLTNEYRPTYQYKNISYTYDNYGNILNVYKTGTGVPSKYVYFEYSPIHPNVLTNYNGTSVSYDALFNITSLNGATLTYTRVNMLSTYSKGTKNASYYYNCDGIRTKKVVNNYVHYYLLDGNYISREIVEQTVSPYNKYQIAYLYGINGVSGFYYNSKLYIYRKDLFNNVIELYEANGLAKSLVAKYRYLDAYGNHEVLNPDDTVNTSSTFIGHINPFRYRSYYYDEESGYYYCNHRYYVPFIYRWLTMDDLSYLDSSSINGINLFAYCKNNPVMLIDPDGNIPKWLYWIIGCTVIAGSIILTIVTNGAAWPILIGTLTGASTGFVFGGFQFTNGKLLWNEESAAKGFMWGAVAGFVSSSISVCTSQLITNAGLVGFWSKTIEFISGSSSSLILARVQALVENEEWNCIRAIASFCFGGVSSFFGKTIGRAFLWGLIFSITENLFDDLVIFSLEQ